MRQINRNRKLMAPAVVPKPTKVAAKPKLKSSNNDELIRNNKLLAGYLAHEYLTKGTLFGEVYGAAARPRAEAVKNASEKPKIAKPIEEEFAEEAAENKKEEWRQYKVFVEVANLLKVEGTHLPGIVNPSHLAEYLGM